MSWWQGAWLIGSKDARYMIRQRETLLWLFVMPVVFMFFIGTITSGFGGDEDDAGGSRPPIVLATKDTGFLVDRLAQRLETVGYTVVLDDGSRDEPARRLVLPAGFSDSLLAGARVGTTLELRRSNLDREHDRVRVSRAVYTLAADLAVTDGEEDEGPVRFGALDATPRTFTVEVTRAGRRDAEERRIPTGFEQAIPGTLTMFTLLVLLTSGAILLVIERQQGLLRRLAATPIPRGAVVAGKWGGRLVLGVVQIAVAMLIGSLFFGMRWGGALPALLGVLLCYAAFNAALGMLLGNLARSEGQAIGIGVLASNLLAALGGCWWPIEITPDWMQRFALALPTGWAMDAMHKLVSFGAGAGSVAPHALVLAAGALACGWLATRTFRYE